MKKRKAIEPLKELPPAPSMNKDSMIKDLNKRLTESLTGNYKITVLDLSHTRRSFCSFEYHLDIKVDITNTNNSDSNYGPIVPGMGKDPITLGTRTLYVNPVYFDFRDMQEQLFTKINNAQLDINENGYHLKQTNKETGKDEYVYV